MTLVFGCVVGAGSVLAGRGVVAGPGVGEVGGLVALEASPGLAEPDGPGGDVVVVEEAGEADGGESGRGFAPGCLGVGFESFDEDVELLAGSRPRLCPGADQLELSLSAYVTGASIIRNISSAIQ